MPDLKETLLTRLGIAEAMGHRAKAAAGRLQQAAAKTHDSHQQELARLQQQIEAAGVGNDEAAEQRYCQLLVERMHLTQAHALSGMDAARMPEIGAPAAKRLQKGRGYPSFIPPDMPAWPAERPRPRDSYHPLNGVEDKRKMEQMAAAMRRGEWTWTVPLVRCGDQLLTGSHRYHAAQVARVPLETVPIDDVFRVAGLDFKSTWQANAQAYDGWLSNMDYALKCLPEELRLKYGLDLG